MMQEPMPRAKRQSTTPQALHQLLFAAEPTLLPQISPWRQRLVRRRMRAGIFSAVSDALPLLRHCAGEARLHRWIDAWLDTAPPRTRFYWRLPVEFATWVMDGRNTTFPSRTATDCLRELAHFEAMQMEVLNAPDPVPPNQAGCFSSEKLTERARMDSRLRGLPKSQRRCFSQAPTPSCHPECRDSDAKDLPTDRGFGEILPHSVRQDDREKIVPFVDPCTFLEAPFRRNDRAEDAVAANRPDDTLRLHPSARLGIYHYPVFEIDKKTKSLPARGAEPCFVLLYRANETCRWLLVSPQVAQLLAQATQNGGSLHETLAFLRCLYGRVDEGFIRRELADLQRRGVLLPPV